MTRTIYTENNERFNPYDEFPQKKYDVVYAPASGSISEFLWKKFGNNKTKLIIYDYEPLALKWKQTLFVTQDLEYSTATVKDCLIADVDFKKVKMNEKIFSNSDWTDTLKMIDDVEFVECNLLNEYLNVDVSKTNFICFSNIFSYHGEDFSSKLEYYYGLINTTICGKKLDSRGWEYHFYNENGQAYNEYNHV